MALAVTSVPLIISGSCNLAFGLDDDFKGDGQVIIGAVMLSVGLLFSIAATVICCVAHRSYKNTTIMNPGQPYNPNAVYANSSMPYNGSPYSSTGAPSYNTGFSSQYNYAPSPGASDTSYPPPPPSGFSGQPGGYPGQPGGYPGQPGGYPPPYGAPNPTAPKM
ncbi:unnamed protein product [Meganyctiphanes norvegica]|uniref:Uncharacterized protein n=1 Tax=Meganyctiphanes norvegica TaxID=48144 RepID=A0AAV2S3J1_MEGNR